ncbi:recombinase family protein [Streptomyces lunaelactis]|uniref:recombinase family protein n=1 Tax=Streptomyces lunaelactis TaxID=1535768 RepID=UPI001585C2D4|nr:recombinase family protein [Streptomyces lunaelactis]NUK09006.1 recombinase family protein [Streptomyces lunaelactis]NUK35503.1 recombinase family protein [Streptomyces lunaelactis]NUK41641.1 recombinase family protein [Streptomyces lunaelactis]NUK58372.1 recombinase family protein [Streptomyces lunaelactis]NUK93447.1 recombinase family protein [Streptomyces lunaelactis]
MHQDEICDLYLRLSLDRDGKTAIERQEADCRAWAERNGLTVRKVHIDRGRSGYKAVERKGFAAALAAVTSGVVGTLVVWKLDRLSRKGIGQVGKVLEEIEKAGSRLVSVVEELDTSNNSARMVVATLAELARSESQNLGTRVRHAKRYLRGTGRWIGGQAPYGLKVDQETKKLIHDPECAEYARLIADEALAGTSLVKIARLLNECEIFSPRGGQWNAASIMQLLRSPAFAGLMPESETVETDDGEKKYTGRVFPYRDPETLHTVEIGEGIISLDERDRIIRQFEARTFVHAGKRRPKHEATALLMGLVFCAVPGCGRRMHRVGNSYQCMARRAGNQCAGASALAETVDNYVTACFLSKLPALGPDDPLIVAIADRWVQRADPETFVKRDVINAEIQDEESRLADLEDARYVRGEFKGVTAIDRYNRLSARLRSRIDGLREDLGKLPMPSVNVTPMLDGPVLRAAWRDATNEERRHRLSLAIDRVEVTKGKRGQRIIPEQRIQIHWAGLSAVADASDAETRR